MPKQSSGGSQPKGVITSFFKPVPSSQVPEQQQASSASQDPIPPPRQSPQLPSSPPSVLNTPVKPAGRSRDAVIAASDEEDDEDESSDDELEDLMAKFDPRRNAAPAPQKPPRTSFETPRAKRTARGSFDSSPLTIQPKHQFDMKALAKDALQDNATNASSLRNREAVKEAAAAADAFASRDDSGNAVLDIVQDTGGANAHKVLRAVQRAAPGQSQLRYCFFDPDYSRPSSTAVPKKVSTGPWKLLTQGNIRTREQYLVSGVPHIILKKCGGLPYELFDWMLDEIFVQQSRLMRQEYVNLTSDCPKFIEEHINPERLEQLFFRAGANEQFRNREDELTVLKPPVDPYEDRDWSCLQSFIELLAHFAPHMSTESVTYALQMLLRMAMDRVLLCNTDILTVYESTIQLLLDALPASSWDSFVSIRSLGNLSSSI